MDALISLPSWLIFVLIIGFFVGVTVAGLWVVWRFVALDLLSEHNDVAGFIFAALGVVYAVIVAFLVIAVWENFEASRRAVDTEAAQVVELHRSMSAFPDAQRMPVDEAMTAYLESVVDDEWPSLRVGDRSQATEIALERLWATVQAIEPATPSEAAWYDQSLQALSDLTLSRDVRLYEAEQRLPTVVTIMLLLGAAITIGYTYLYGVRNRTGHLLMTVALAVTIAIVVSLIVMLDAPFHGDTSIDPDPIEKALLFVLEGPIE